MDDPAANVEHPAKFKTFWPRFWSGLIDGLVLMPLAWVDSLVWDHLTTPVLLLPWYIAFSLSGIAYTIYLHGRFGQTIGKWLMKVKVLDISESRLSMKQAMLRDSIVLILVVFMMAMELPLVASGTNPALATTFTVAQWVSVYLMLAWFVLELLTMLTNPKRRALHDFIAGSVVVRLPHKE